MTLRVMTFTTKKSPVLDGFKASMNGKKTVWNKAHTVFCGRFKTVQDFRPEFGFWTVWEKPTKINSGRFCPKPSRINNNYYFFVILDDHPYFFFFFCLAVIVSGFIFSSLIFKPQFFCPTVCSRKPVLHIVAGIIISPNKVHLHQKKNKKIKKF